ncbi:MAG: MBL fold metallo-hydrolase [Neomegalonema sp.]|nr:MBL fold metallo-hydrolase [Neomegalonema sp.]
MSGLVATILGCGSSGGVPRLGGADGAGLWGACDPSNPKNRRSRCALLVERTGPAGVTRVLLDTGPDFRQQMLAAKVAMLDAVLYTHDHADHTHGLDDLRQVVFAMRKMVQVWADQTTRDVLMERFRYTFETPVGSSYPPILQMNLIEPQHFDPASPIVIEGAGGPIAARPFLVRHGGSEALGFRIAAIDDGVVSGPALAYLPDADEIYAAAWPALAGLDVFIVDALRYTPHPSHAHVDLALEWVARARPKRAVLTDLHVDLDYETLKAETPPHVEPAYDGMRITLS